MQAVIYATTGYIQPLNGSVLLIGASDHSTPGNWIGEHLVAFPGERYPRAFRELRMFTPGEGFEEFLPTAEDEARRLLDLATLQLELTLAKVDSEYFRNIFLLRHLPLKELDLPGLKRGRLFRTWNADFDWIKHNTQVSTLKDGCAEVLKVPLLYREERPYQDE